MILKNLVSRWPLVKLSETSANSSVDYLKQFYQGQPIGAFTAEPEINGRYFYQHDLSQLNFCKQYSQLDILLDQLIEQLAEQLDEKKAPGIYVGSAHVDQLLPGFRSENDLSALRKFKPLMSIWLSNQSRIAAHHDVPNNIACCITGKRRFTLFPPEQLENLYIGPLDNTPAGQAVSLVDFHQPDWVKFPKFERALQQAQVAELDAGDALFLPSMWWHHVESLSSFNILVNYWWQTTTSHMGAPMDAMMHALLNIKNLPHEQKEAWFEMFKYYIFNNDTTALSHIPNEQLGVLNPMDNKSSRQIRSMLLNKLNK